MTRARDVGASDGDLKRASSILEQAAALATVQHELTDENGMEKCASAIQKDKLLIYINVATGLNVGKDLGGKTLLDKAEAKHDDAVQVQRLLLRVAEAAHLPKDTVDIKTLQTVIDEAKAHSATLESDLTSARTKLNEAKTLKQALEKLATLYQSEPPQELKSWNLNTH